MLDFKKLCLSLMLAVSAPAFAEVAFVDKPEVKTFIHFMAKTQHFNQKELTAIFAKVQFQPQVIDNINHPLEKLSWKFYQRVFITNANADEGAAFRQKYRSTLVKAEKIYGVPASIIISTLGCETKFGKHIGPYRVIDSLSSLAFSTQPRALYFREELAHLLIFTRAQHLDPFKIKGSYAGAIGAPQFMPSSYRYYAASLTRKTRIDITHNLDDAIASIANYYQKHGWKTPNYVAVPVTLSGANYKKILKADGTPLTFPSAKLSIYGIKPQTPIKKGYKLKLLTLEGAQGTEHWVVFPDFEVIKRYNPSNLYAMAIYQLSRDILKFKRPIASVALVSSSTSKLHRALKAESEIKTAQAYSVIPNPSLNLKPPYPGALPSAQDLARREAKLTS